VLAFADGAILLAGAILFRLIAHDAYDGTGHGSLQGKLYLTMAMRGKACVTLQSELLTASLKITAGTLVSRYLVPSPA
jgi:hypothetical protein